MTSGDQVLSTEHYDSPVVFVDRYYDDDWDAPQPWLRRRRSTGWPEWIANTGGTAVADVTAGFDDVDEAIAWGRKHARMVLVRLGSSEDMCYSAGDIHAHEYLDGSGRAYAQWPPEDWPDYEGPTEEARRFWSLYE
jgi:hypothetical protein